MNLIERIDHWGEVTPRKVAQVSGDRSLTYGALRTRSDSVASYLVRTLRNDGSPVAVLGHREPEMLIAFLASVKAGHPYIPIDTALPSHRIAKIIASAGAKVVLTPESMAATKEVRTPLRYPGLNPADPYYIIFTSGSSGEPKGVSITLDCLTTFVDWMLAEHSFLTSEETFLNQAPFSFDLSVMDLYLSLVTGGTLFSVSRDLLADPKRLYQQLTTSGITTWVSTPSFAQMCLAERGFGRAMLPHLRRFLFCGETLAPEIAAQLLSRFPEAQVWNTYGPTEATVATTSVRVDRALLERYSPLPVGFPMPGTTITVTDADGAPVTPGERGEIIIAGKNVSPGYFGRTDLTDRSFFQAGEKRAYRTGDWGRFRDGMLFFEGRMDHQIKLNGYRIELGDLEANLRALPGVRDAAVILKTKNGVGQSLTAFLILSEPPTTSDFETGNAIRRQLAERLPSYMLPKKFRFVETFPRTENGKTDREKLAAAIG